MTPITVLVRGPSAATSTRPNRIIGMDSEISTRRMMSASTQPPQYPAVMPRAVPAMPLTTMAISAMMTEMRLP